VTDRAKLDAFSRRCKRIGYCELSVPTVAELFRPISYYVYFQTKTTPCRHYLKHKHRLTRWLSKLIIKHFVKTTAV